MNIWIKVYGHITPGGDPVYQCPHCKATHIYGIEHPYKQEKCENCGQRNYYPWEKQDEEKIFR